MLYEKFEVVLEVTTDTRQLMNYRNVVSLQLVCWSNPRQHQQLWWVDCSSTQYHLVDTIQSSKRSSTRNSNYWHRHSSGHWHEVSSLDLALFTAKMHCANNLMQHTRFNKVMQCHDIRHDMSLSLQLYLSEYRWASEALWLRALQYQELQVTDNTVSYTHLTLPTIYSV